MQKRGDRRSTSHCVFSVGWSIEEVIFDQAESAQILPTWHVLVV